MSSATPASKRQFHGRLARTLLIILLLLSVIPLLLMGDMAYLRTRSMLRQQASAFLTSAVSSQGERFRAEAVSAQLLLGQAVSGRGLTGGLAEALQSADRSSEAFAASRSSILKGLSSLNSPRPFFNQFLVVDTRGAIQVASRLEWEGEAIPVSAFEGLEPGQARSLAADSLEPLYPGALIILTAAPLFDAQGSRTGLVLGITESPIIKEWIDRAAFFTTGHYIVTLEGKFFGSSPYPNSPNKLVQLQQEAAYQRAITAGLASPERSGVQELVSFQGKPVFAAYAWLPELGVGWVAEAPQEAFFGQLNSLLVPALLAIAGVMALAGVAAWQAQRGLAGSLLSLVRTMHAFAEGNWDQRAPVRRNDEAGLLADAYNRMSAELAELLRSQRFQVEEYADQARTIAAAAEIAASSASLDELLRRSVDLIADYFPFHYTAIYLVEESTSLTSRRFTVLRRAAAPPGIEKKLLGRKVEIEASTLAGWVTAFNQLRVDDVADGSRAAWNRDDLLPGTGQEVGVPIAAGDQVFGCFHMQAPRQCIINQERLSELQALVNQLAPSFQSFRLLGPGQRDQNGTDRLVQVSRQIAQAETEAQVFERAAEALRPAYSASAILLPGLAGVRIFYPSASAEEQAPSLPGWLAIPLGELETRFSSRSPVVILDFEAPDGIPAGLLYLARLMNCDAAAFLPVMRPGRLAALFLLGASRDEAQANGVFTMNALQPTIKLADLITTTLEKVQAQEDTRRRLAELQLLGALSESMALGIDVSAIYPLLHQQIQQLMGEVDLTIALFNPETRLIDIPYSIEKGRPVSIPSFPLGEGLASILIRTGQPLLLAEDAESKMREMGVSVAAGSALSWLGVPLMLGGEATGAIIVQDCDQENRFDEGNQRLLSILAAQIAVAVRNARLYENTSRQTERLRLLNEITGKIRRSSGMAGILKTTADEVAQAFGARRARIQIGVIDPPNRPPLAPPNAAEDEYGTA